MLKEIGSDFWLNRYKTITNRDLNLDLFGIPHFDSALLSSGRSAISFVLDHVETKGVNKKALLPSYICNSVVEPFVKSGYQVDFFHINWDMSCRREHLLEKLDKTKPGVLLLLGYFGFNTLANISEVVVKARDSGVVVIHDVTQTFYSKYDHIFADFYIGSFRKWGPLPDGGFALSTQGKFKDKPKCIDVELQEAKLTAYHAKYLYMNKGQGNKEVFLELYKHAEGVLNDQQGYYAIADISRGLQANMDLIFLRDQRRANFQNLLEIPAITEDFDPVFRILPAAVTPLYFPVYVKKRFAFQRFLSKHDIYCPVVWPKPTYCIDLDDEEVNWVYDHLLAIPCDQRYSEDEMRRIGEVISHFAF